VSQSNVKAAEDSRTPRRWRAIQHAAPSARSWSAAVLCRFVIRICFCLFFSRLIVLGAEQQSNSVAMEALSRLKDIDLESNPAVKNAVLKVLEQVKGTPQFVETVRDFNITGQEPALLDFACKEPASSAAAEAVRIVLHNDGTNLISATLDGTNGPALVDALANTREKEIVPLLEPRLLDNSRNPVFRRKAVHALCGVREGAELLLRLAKEQLLPEDVRFVASSDLNNVHWPEIKAEAAKLLPLPAAQNAEPLPPISQLIQMSGDSTRGAAVFRRDNVGCIKCHQVRGEGVDFGPNLSEIGTKLGKDALFESILDPSAGISFGYEAWQLELKNGDEAYGLISSETEDELTIKAVGGITTRYKKGDIAKRTKQKLSIMPAGLQQNMSTQELTDLVDYLATLKKAAP
jgi:putative heme-binding domain-containing protein